MQVIDSFGEDGDMLLSIVSRDRLPQCTQSAAGEEEFFSPYGIRSISKVHQEPYVVNIQGQDFDLQYEPAESKTGLFGGNSNWRGPIWTPMNYMLIQSLKEFHRFYGDECLVKCPYDANKKKNLGIIAEDISKNLISIFEKQEDSSRPVHALDEIYRENPDFNDLILFYEYFHGDNGRGVGASHQTGWTGIVAELIDRIHNHPAK